MQLTLGDYDSDGQLLLVRDTKFYKSRFISLSADAAVEIECYLDRRRNLGLPCGADTPLLIHRHGGRRQYTGAGLGRLIRKLFCTVDVRTSCGRLPRTHDFRFTFAVHAMLRWYRAGVDVQARLPALSTYMGHASIASTQYYLTFLDDVAFAASDRFEHYCSDFLPSPSSEEGAP